MSWMISAGSVSAAIAVVAGAFGAHALKNTLEPDLLAIFEVGVRYQMYHALGLILLGAIASVRSTVWLRRSGYSMLVGTFFFSGSLYVLSLTGARWLGAITPIGGVAFVAGWLMLMIAFLRK